VTPAGGCDDCPENTLTYTGREADESQIDLYDAGHALVGLHRSLALTAHLIINNEIITQATSLKGVRIVSAPPQEGSWKTVALILGAIYAGGSVTKDSPVGNLVSSAYDYVIHETLGFHVDYNKTLGKQYEKYQETHPKIKRLPEYRFHSLCEKCESAIRDMHRPLYFSRTAELGKILSNAGPREKALGVDMNEETAEYLYTTVIRSGAEEYIGEVYAYHTATYKDRIYVRSVNRIIGFVLDESCRPPDDLFTITNSLTANAKRNGEHFNQYSFIKFIALTFKSKSGRLKSFRITSVAVM
jgi:hypothetical protein